MCRRLRVQMSRDVVDSLIRPSTDHATSENLLPSNASCGKHPHVALDAARPFAPLSPFITPIFIFVIALRSSTTSQLG